LNAALIAGGSQHYSRIAARRRERCSNPSKMFLAWTDLPAPRTGPGACPSRQG
jgi:hypothetical protein